MKNASLNLPEGFTYTAHTGCAGTADNSLESIEAGAKYGAPIVEFDLSFTADGTPILAHDSISGNEVTLDRAFEKVSEYECLMANVDIKGVENLPEVTRLAKKHGISNRFFYTGVFEYFLDAVKEYTPEVKYYLNVDVEAPDNQTPAYLNSLVEKVKDSGAVGINFNKDSATKELVDIFHKNGLLVSIWTANTREDINKILNLSPDNITTRNPDLLQAILNKINGISD